MIRPLSAVILAAALAGCDAAAPVHLVIPGADPGRGRALIHAYGCGACHAIPGVRGARGRVGPSLADWSARKLLAGRLGNAPEHLVAWLLDPVAVNPRTGMPALGLDEAQARDIASYLYTLGAPDSRVAPTTSGLNPADVPRPRELPGRGPFVDGAFDPA